jgi:LuxR family transcriptional regulator, regulator of acetate metabolism
VSGSPSFTPTVGRAGWRRRSSVLRERVDDLDERVGAQLSGAGLHALPGADRPVRDWVHHVEELTNACLAGMGDAVLGPDAAGELGVLVCDLQALWLELHDHRLVSRTLRLADCERALGRLRSCATTASLLGSVCEEASRSCGFERVLLSRVEDGRWYPWLVNSAIAEEPWVVPWSRRSMPLDELWLEARLVADHRPELVLDASGSRVPAIVRDGGSQSYVAAPVGPTGSAVGFFHADHGAGGARCTATDRDVLWRFAEGFGRLYERTALLERMRAQRTRVRGLLSVVDDAMAELTESEFDLAVHPDRDPPHAEPAISMARSMSARLDGLTPRERDVLELIVEGARNAEIAERLDIGAGTVKSHVKHILAKLGAVNRSQVVAQYLGFRDGWGE